MTSMASLVTFKGRRRGRRPADRRYRRSGGGDLGAGRYRRHASSREASDEALREVFDATGVRPSRGDFDPGAFPSRIAGKVAILVTDARPAGCDDTYTPGVDDVAAHARVTRSGGPRSSDRRALRADVRGSRRHRVHHDGLRGDGRGACTARRMPAAPEPRNAIEQVVLNCIGAGATELCCIDETDCVEVLEGQCSTLGGEIVETCVGCGATPIEVSSWGKIKSSF